MLLEQPYDSKSLLNIDKNNINHSVNRYILTDYGYMISNKQISPRTYTHNGKLVKEVLLVSNVPSIDSIPELTFPVYIPESQSIVIDLRRYLTYERQSQKIIIKRELELETLAFRNQMIALWILGNNEQMYFFKMPHLAFAKWISTLITGKFGLDYSDSYMIEILAMIYYSRLFNNGVNRDRKGLDLLRLRLKGQLYNEDLIEKIWNQTLSMETLDDFCEMVPVVTGNVRLEGFSPTVLLRITQTSWMGTDYKQNLALALEYPPIWISMCYEAVTNNMYKRTQIGDRIESLGRRGEAKQFVKEVDDFLRLKIGVK